jgi:hypothetical protein
MLFTTLSDVCPTDVLVAELEHAGARARGAA